VIVVIEDGDVPLAEIAMRTHFRAAGIEAVEIAAGVTESLGYIVQDGPHGADVERRIQIATEHIQIAILREIAAGNFAHEQKIVFAEVGREFLDRAAEVSALFEGHVLERVDAVAVAVGQRDPVAIAGGEMIEHAGIVQRQVAQREEVRALVLGMRILQAPRAEIALARARVARGILQFLGPHAFVFVADFGTDPLAVAPKPGTEIVMAREGLEGGLGDSLRIHPVESGVIENDVEDDANVFAMRRLHQLDQIRARTEARIDVEEMLDTVTMEGIQVTALLEHGAQPNRRHTEIVEVVELRLHAFDRAALPAMRAGFRP
jgi:hypothetical protein